MSFLLGILSFFLEGGSFWFVIFLRELDFYSNNQETSSYIKVLEVATLLLVR